MAPTFNRHYEPKFLTEAVNSVKKPTTFWKELLFSDERTIPAEVIEWEEILGDRLVAPFVERDAEALKVDGYTHKPRAVSGVNIRLKRPMMASHLMFKQAFQTGNPSEYITSPLGQANRAAALREDMSIFDDLITNAEEWLCASAVKRSISYSVPGEAVFTCTYPRDSGFDVLIPVGEYWSVGAAAPVAQHFKEAKRKMARDEGLQVTHCIVPPDVGDALSAWFASNQAHAHYSRIAQGTLQDYVTDFTQYGAHYIGRIHGIEVWEYSMQTQVKTSSGYVSVDLVEPKKAQFVSATPKAGNFMAYLPIPDMTALAQNLAYGKRFMKSKEEFDPSVYTGLVHTRPFPIVKRPNSIYTAKVLA